MEVYPDKPNWCKLLKDLLCTLGMYDAWYFQEIGNTEYFYILLNRDYVINLYKSGKDG